MLQKQHHQMKEMKDLNSTRERTKKPKFLTWRRSKRRTEARCSSWIDQEIEEEIKAEGKQWEQTISEPLLPLLVQATTLQLQMLSRTKP